MIGDILLTEYRLNSIIDYLSGNMTEERQSDLKNWMAESDQNQQCFEDIKKLWIILKLPEEQGLYDSQKAYQLFKSRIYSDLNHEQDILLEKKRISQKWFYAAAILIPFLFLSYFTSLYFIPPKQSEEVFRVSEVIVPNGSKTQLKLEDGTLVWLNAGSKIEYDVNPGKKYRELKLSGEAYLEVAPDKEHPFIVSAGDMKVKVLGTRFNINSYPENKAIEVALLEGAVEIDIENTPPVLLSPNDLASYNLASKETLITKNNTTSSISWIQNKLLFNGETFEQIIYTLERNFNVQITIHKESVKAHCYVGDFVNNETIEQIFHVMSANNKFEYKIKENRIDVY